MTASCRGDGLGVSPRVDMSEESLAGAYDNSSESCSSAADDTIQKRSRRVHFFTGTNPDYDFWEDCQNGESSITDPTRLSLADTRSAELGLQTANLLVEAAPCVAEVWCTSDSQLAAESLLSDASLLV